MKVRVTVDVWADENEDLDLLASEARHFFGVVQALEVRDIDVEAL